MRTRLTPWLTALLALGATAGPALAQQAAPAAADRGMPIVEYAAAAILSGIVLLVVCYPARNNSYS